MHPLLWIQRLFAPKPENDENGLTGPAPEEQTPFTWNQHLRIILAIVVMIISAMVMWWIVA